MNDCDVKKVISLFHGDAPVSYETKTVRDAENDKRFVIFVTANDKKYVIKLACNTFTFPERINGAAWLTEEYLKLGCYSPRYLKSLGGYYAETVILDGVTFYAWEEEFAKYSFPDSFLGGDDVYAFFAKVGALGLKGDFGVSGYARLVPFALDEKTDEVSACVDSFDSVVKEKAPEFASRWDKIFSVWKENKEKLSEIYERLPRSVFQADWNRYNVLVDENGDFVGLVDYNICGEDTTLNMAISMGLFGYASLHGDENGEIFADDEENVRKTLSVFARNYCFSDEEIKAAPILFKYVNSIYYSEYEELCDNICNDEKLRELFDSIEMKLTKEVDFSKSMK